MTERDLQRAIEEFDTDRETMGDAKAIAEITRKLRQMGFCQVAVYQQIVEAMQ